MNPFQTPKLQTSMPHSMLLLSDEDSDTDTMVNEIRGRLIHVIKDSMNPDNPVNTDPEDHEDPEDLEDREIMMSSISHPTHLTMIRIDDLLDEEPPLWNEMLGCSRPLQIHLLPEPDHRQKRSSTTSTSLAISPHSMETTTRSLITFLTSMNSRKSAMQYGRR
jgi:hypothetical protein